MVAPGMSGELSGQVAIVTGGASGIGAASAALLEGQGAHVIVADIQNSKDGPGRFVSHDVASEESWKSLLADVLGSEGRLDIMVNNAGVSGSFENAETTTVESWQRVQAINSEGVFLGCKYAIQGMKTTGPDKPASRGSIVNISSVAGLIGSAGPTAYTASKGAVRQFTKTVAIDCARKGYKVRCNSVHPGVILTPMGEGILSSETARERTRKSIPIGDFGAPEDIAYGILYLISDESRFVTGAELVIDGGMNAI